MTVYRGRIQLLAKPAADWIANNPVLLNGEFGVQDPATSTPILKVGDGVRPWSTLPPISGSGGGSQNYVVGSTTTLAPGAFATVTIDNTVSPPTISFGIPRGTPGPANTLAIGTVTTGAPGTPAAATVTGVAPNQTLNLTIPMGPQGPIGLPGADGANGLDGGPGPVGPAGPPNTLAIGVVTTGAPGSAAAATITGAAPNQTLNLTIPTGAQGPQGIQGIQGPTGPPGGAGTVGDPLVKVGLVAVPGSGIIALRNDGAPALDQNIAPTWTALHTNARAAAEQIRLVRDDATLTFYNAANTVRSGYVQMATTGGLINVEVNQALTFRTNNLDRLLIGANGTATFSGAVVVNSLAAGAWALSVNGSAVAASLGVLITAGTSGGDYALWVRSANAGNRPYLLIYGNGTFEFGNTTDNPTYNFTGTGVTSFGGRVSIVSAGIPLSVRSTSIERAVDIASDMPNGPYVTLLRGATPIADFGNAASVISGGVVDGFAISPRGAKPIIFGTNSGVECARFCQDGSLQITGTYSGGTGTKNVAGLELYVAFDRTYCGMLAYNRGTAAYLPLQVNCASMEISGPGAATLNMQSHTAFRDLADGYLRVNDLNHYANGVYTPYVMRADGGFQTQAGFGLQQQGGALSLKLNTTASMSYGSVAAQGTTNGYHGYGINDGGLRPTFMSNNSNAGIFVESEGKWLITRDTLTGASSSYNLSAVSFTSTSARASKRETGTLTGVRAMLAKLRPVLYRMLTDDEHEQLGLIAEEVHDVCPQLSDGKTVAYDRIALLLLADWQESHAA